MSLGARVTLSVVVLIAVTSLGMTVLLSSQERDNFLADRHALLSTTALSDGARLRHEIDDLRQSVLFLSRMPPVSGIARAARNHGVDPRGGNSIGAWKKRLEVIFAAFGEARPNYSDIRYIGVADGGLELARVGIRAGHATVASREQLQTQAARDFFQAALKLNAGEVHLAEIGLDTEQGKFGTPHATVLHAATPVFGSDGVVFGVLVIDLDYSYLSRGLTPLPTNDVAARIANSSGDYLTLPELGQSAEFDSGPHSRWQDELPGLQLPPSASGEKTPLQHLSSAGKMVYAMTGRVAIDPLRPERHLLLIYTFPEAAVDAHVASVRGPMLIGVGIAGLLILVLLLWLVRRTFAPLERLTRAAQAIAAGRYDVPLPESGDGELNTLVRSFHTMQESIALRDAQFRAILETAADGFWFVDTSGRIVDINESYVRLSGYTRKELLSMDVADLEAHESPEQVSRRMQEILRTGDVRFETEHRRKDGTLWPVEMTIAYWPIGEGRFFAFLRDITERQAAERRLREERDRTRLYLAVAEVFIVVLDSAARIALINRQGCETLGWREEELIGRPWPDCCAAPARIEWASFFSRLMAGEAAPTDLSEYAVTTRDGTTRLIEWRRVVLYDAQGKPGGTVSSGRDVTEERRAQQALAQHQAGLEAAVQARTVELQKSEARARAVLTTMLDGVAHIDADGILLSVNHAILAMFDYREEELIGRSVSVLMPEPEAAAHDGHLRRYVRTGEAHIVGRRREVTGRRKDGSRIPIELAVNEMFDDQGSSFIGVIRDMTSQKAGEQELQAALCAAQIATQAKGRFLANMSHEIRTPLNGVLGFAQIGMRDSAGSPAGETFGRIADAGQHLLGVINAILDFSKIEAGKLVVEKQPFALLAAIDNVASFVAARAESKGLRLSVSLAPELPDWVVGDGLRLTQILTNLLSNAVKFTSAGDVSLSVARDGDGIAFRVTDTGIGMSEEQRARLFKPFEQADSATTRTYGGTGLGLAISLDLARLMGGDINVDSHPCAGSSFILRLPLPAVDAPERATGPVSGAGPGLSGLSVLAADDVEINRLLLGDLLQHEGARVVFAETGLQAIERLEQAGTTAFDVVLMDIQMPVMDGFEATRRIRAIAPALKILGLTAHALPEERAKCLAAGMAEVVTKPIDIRLLVEAIRRQVPLPCGAAAPVAVPPAPTFGVFPAVAPAATDCAVDWPALLARFNGRKAFVVKLATSLYKHYANTSAKLRIAAQQGDRDALRFIAHDLKGISGNLEALPLYDLAKTFEASLRAGENFTTEEVDVLVAAFEAVLAEVGRFVSHENGSSSIIQT